MPCTLFTMRDINFEVEQRCPECSRESKYRGNDGNKIAYWQCNSCGNSYETYGEKSTVKSLEIKRGYLNVNEYPDKTIGGTLFATRKEADEHAQEDRIACVMVSYRGGQGLK